MSWSLSARCALRYATESQPVFSNALRSLSKPIRRFANVSSAATLNSSSRLVMAWLSPLPSSSPSLSSKESMSSSAT